MTICIALSGLGLGEMPRACTLSIKTIKTNRVWDLLPGVSQEKALVKAAQLLSRRRIILAGATVDGNALRDIEKRSRGADLTRAFREHLRVPIDPLDVLSFLDDLWSASPSPFKSGPLSLSPSRLRSLGILLHPEGVFRGRPRDYGDPAGTVVVSETPGLTLGLPPPEGGLLGPRWSLRYQQPNTEQNGLWALYRVNPDFAQRIRSLVRQFREQGATITVESTLRDRRRGFLTYGAYILSRSKSNSELSINRARVTRLNKEWGLKVPINWFHSDAWKRTVLEAKKMAEAFGVTYASEYGAAAQITITVGR